ncbi:type IV pilus biogenesis protein PilP [Maritimibacter sp. DP1N21-5]|uniref:type IV pilus biogenesis protein PilP n=1 Tax=Maritimibacter sp. DP1N21-5 TaxID=2836867 RepID=UPI001C467E02|nr:type IV pilus biogenesis protein PilP [Maritimibacter sp. DP1N21-5]MBV7410177.1 type IV pilus biogenesis protein PilP [Maritimibacter sp. DP1N21-5]
MKPNCALDLTHDGIRLLVRDSSGWKALGEVALDDPEMTNHLADLRRKAEGIVGTISSKLIIPNSQILYTTLDASGEDDATREVQIRAGLEGLTPYDVRDLVFDWRIDGQTARVAVLARETMDEAESFADQFGFNPVSFVARPEGGTFSGEPFFGASKVASRILSGARVQPDAAPVPRNPRAYDDGTAKPSSTKRDSSAGLDPFPPTSPPPEAPATKPEPPTVEPELTAPEEPEVVTEPAPTGPAIRAGIADAGLPPEDDVKDETTSERPVREDRLTWHRPDPVVSSPATTPEEPTAEVEADSDDVSISDSPSENTDAESTAAETRPARRSPSARRGPPPVSGPKPSLAPFPPTDDDRPSPSPILRTPSRAPATPTAPAAPTPPRSSAVVDQDKTPAAEGDVSQPASGAKPAPSFSSRRIASATEGDATPEADTASITSDAAPAADATPAQDKPKPAPKVAIDDTDLPAPRLSGDAEKRRLAMARALGHTLDEAPEPEKRGWFNRKPKAPAAPAPRSSEPAEARNDTPQKRALPGVIAPLPEDFAKKPEPKPEPAPKPARQSRKSRKADPQTAARSKEAEAMTVFGARRDAGSRGRPRYMGLILTLILILLMAIAAIWSTLATDDEVALFNPEPTEAPSENTEVANADAVTDQPSPDAPSAPPSDTGAVLSPEAAEARYAATGVWQRAPEPLADPTTSSADDVYVASIDPAISGSDALSLPQAGAGADAPPVTPSPPPPPGTSFDIGDDGLVVPTPEGSVTPTGALVVQGRPPVVPPARPADLVTELPEDDAALAPEDAALPAPTDIRPRTRPENLTELAERAQLGGQTLAELSQSRPRPRPDDLDTTLPETELAASETDPETAAEIAAAIQLASSDEEAAPAPEITDATELAVARSIRPGERPGNFTQVVARAQEAQTEAPPDTRQAAVENAPVGRDDADDGEPEVIAAAAPSGIPSSASVASTATMKNALNLRQVNVIGIYGSNSARRALVRMSNGRYVKVAVGDRLDGGRVTSISASRVIYQKGNRQYALDVLPLG